MTTEALLSPRYLISIDYPNNRLKVGTIIENGNPLYYNQFPAIFRQLAWYEMREEKDMPRFAKKYNDEIIRITFWDMSIIPQAATKELCYSAKYLTPCTEQEYLQQQNKKG